MIFDCLENCKTYYGVNPRMEKAFAFLKECFDCPKAAGRYEIDGNDLYAMIQEYAPFIPEHPRLETHDKYIDIQCVLSGSERIVYAPRKKLKLVEPYDPGKDVTLYAYSDESEFLRLSEGCFSVFFPHDGHTASMPDGISESCRKVIVKVRC